LRLLGSYGGGQRQAVGQGQGCTLDKGLPLSLGWIRICCGLIPAFVGYQSVQDLLPDALLVIGGDAFLTAFLNAGKPVLESILVCWWT